MDKIAEVVGLDPWSVRFINAYHDGDMKPHRKLVEDATLIETMQAAAKLVGHELPAAFRAMTSAPRTGRRAPDVAKLRGTGMSAVNYPTGMNLGGDPSQALIHATTSGSFVVSLSATDLGQGLRTVIGQIAAETLGVRDGGRRRRHGRHGHRAARHGHVRQPRHAPRRQRRHRRRRGGPRGAAGRRGRRVRGRPRATSSSTGRATSWSAAPPTAR